jgi:hypothetical protein
MGVNISSGVVSKPAQRASSCGPRRKPWEKRGRKGRLEPRQGRHQSVGVPAVDLRSRDAAPNGADKVGGACPNPTACAVGQRTSPLPRLETGEVTYVNAYGPLAWAVVVRPFGAEGAHAMPPPRRPAKYLGHAQPWREGVANLNGGLCDVKLPRRPERSYQSSPLKLATSWYGLALAFALRSKCRFVLAGLKASHVQPGGRKMDRKHPGATPK